MKIQHLSDACLKHAHESIPLGPFPAPRLQLFAPSFQAANPLKLSGWVSPSPLDLNHQAYGSEAEVRSS